ncbi:MAG: gliding motility-associated C-terminal domain-containing protein [Bacteroidales bacterium]|nr:gliding motility-associated C-terminal domain-containing protein [Bacteroidales bacterium]
MNRYLLIIALFSLSFSAQSQVNIGGVVNSYYAVTGLGANSVTCSGTEDLSGLKPGDKVLLMQMTGARINTSGSWFLDDGVHTFYGTETGAYEFLSVNYVSGQNVYFTANLKRAYVSTEKIQLIKVFEAENATVISQLLATPWNGAKGGVIALVVLKKLMLNANINASGAGFRGGAAEFYYEGCRPAYSPDTFYFTTATIGKAGLKGEGLMTTSFAYTKGMGNFYTGGGGGAGMFGGGAGGSNYGAGGIGGAQGDPCTPAAGQYARGGISLLPTGYYSNSNNNVAMGGGGGASTYNLTYSARAGGNGGGIVFILTDSLVGNGYSIMANGNQVFAAQAGGSGGGAGGSVVLDASGYANNLYLSVNGGKGGDGGASGGGGGGGGGGGIIWYSGTSLPAQVHLSFSKGERGTSQTLNRNGTVGYDGGPRSEFVPVLNGFVFNAIRDNDTICQGKVPRLLIGTTPKGIGPFSFEWLQSTDSVNWTVIPSATTKDYQPPALDVTTYYTRVVTDGSNGKTDTALSVEIFVFPAITGNSLMLRDTICSGIAPGMLNANPVAGGDGLLYYYTWQSKNLVSEWQTIGSLEEHNETNQLTNTTFYRRIVVSAKVCADTSETDTLTVLPQIVNNDFFTPDSTICYGLQSGVLTPKSVSGGDGNYRYKWLESADNIGYSEISGETSSQYNPGALATTMYFARVVYSGNDDACIDTSNAKTIEVLPSLGNNIVEISADLICYNTQPLAIIGSLPDGGSGSYTYQWFTKNGAAYTSISGANGQGYQPPSLTDTAIYVRRVISGDDNACTDTSNELVIKVVPQIFNNLVSKHDTLCENNKPLPFAEYRASGGAGAFTYKWINKTLQANWSDAPAPNTDTLYSAVPLVQTTFFSRVAYSSICSDTSAPIEITVYPKIENNFLSGGAEQYVCYNLSKSINGLTPQGGNSAYSYIWQNSSDAFTWGYFSNTAGINTGNLNSAVYFRRIVLSGEGNECADTSSNVLVKINPLPAGDIESVPDTLCKGGEVTINYQGLTGNGPWTMKLGTETNELFTSPALSGTSGSLAFALNSSVDIKVLSIQDDSACFADLSANSGIVRAVVYEMPVANAGAGFEVCGPVARLNAAPSVGIGAWKIADGLFDDPAKPDALVTTNQYGLVDISWTETNWRECTDEDIVSVMFYEQPLEIDAGDDIKSINYDTVLNASFPAVGYGFWKFNDSGRFVEFGDSLSNSTSVTVDGEGEYTFIWTIINGICPAISDSVVLLVDKTTFYEGFSPDGDGINDNFIVEFTRGRLGRLTIFNRNGRQIWQKNGEGQIEWDGTTDFGGDAPADTYFYIFERLDNTDKPKKGFIELRRNNK